MFSSKRTDETYYKIKLAFSENVGPITYRDLLKYFPTAREAVLHLSEFANRGGRKRPLKIASDEYVEQQLETAEKTGVEILTWDSDLYPYLLKEIEDRPPILFVKGNSLLFRNTGIGIVGSRNSSINGQNIARKISHDLAKNNYAVISGMALGIDKAAHEGALKNTNGKGGTIAVLGTGIDYIYPTENEALYHTLAEQGCIVSELPFGTLPRPHFFPRRNRIISGMSVGVVVIEANKLSGSLITAKCALEQNREVFAVPGSPADSRSDGPNKLIQDGAHLVTCAEDIMRTLDFDTTKMLFDSVVGINPPKSYTYIDEKALSDAREIILSLLSPEVIGINQLIRNTGLPTELVNVILVELELAGRIERFAGQQVSLIYNNEW